MGRNTFESLSKGAFLNRENIVLTSDKNYSAENITVVHSIDEVMNLKRDEIIIIGGQKLYEQFIDKADKLENSYFIYIC